MLVINEPPVQQELFVLDGNEAVQGVARKMMGPWRANPGYNEVSFRCPVCEIGKCWAYRTAKSPCVYVRCTTVGCIASEGWRYLGEGR